jgi:hypothetical protein
MKRWSDFSWVEAITFPIILFFIALYFLIDAFIHLVSDFWNNLND